jgi:DNA-binding response OmpR family regulator
MDGRRMLVVDDDVTASELLRRVFAGMRVDVVVAHTVAEGLRLLATVPDFIVLDVALPDGEGRILLDHVRRSGLPSRVAVTSVWGLPGEGRADVVLCKPIDPDA